MNLSRCLPNTSTFVPNDRSQCLYCVLPIMRCAFQSWRSPRRWPGGTTNLVQIRWKSHVSFPLSWGRWPSLIRQNRSENTDGASEQLRPSARCLDEVSGDALEACSMSAPEACSLLAKNTAYSCRNIFIYLRYAAIMHVYYYYTF